MGGPAVSVLLQHPDGLVTAARGGRCKLHTPLTGRVVRTGFHTFVCTCSTQVADSATAGLVTRSVTRCPRRTLTRAALAMVLVTAWVTVGTTYRLAFNESP